jgi:peptidoglycan/LPS O-acetylase OafA/YrhL
LKLNRLGYIDAIRGLAAASVIYFHSSQDILHDGQVKGAVDQAIVFTFSTTLDLGKIAVVTFFCVSGFVIPFSLLRGSTHNIRDFLISRVFRLYPAYWASILIGVAFYRYHNDWPLTGKMLIANVTMFQQFIGIPNIIGVYWTLQIELTFYLVCAALFMVGLLRQTWHIFLTMLFMVALALVLAAVRSVVHAKLPVALPLGMACMFWAFLWRKYVLEEASDAPRWCLAGTLVLLCALPVICLLAYTGTGSGGSETMRYITTYYTAIALFTLLTTRLKLNNPVLFYLGAISYSLYLVGGVVQKVIHQSVYGTVLASNGQVETAISIGVSIVVAGLLYRFIERPCVNLGRSVIRSANHGLERGSAVVKQTS